MLLCPLHSPGKNTGLGCHTLLQGIFPTQDWPSSLMSPALAGGFFTTSAKHGLFYYCLLDAYAAFSFSSSCLLLWMEWQCTLNQNICTLTELTSDIKSKMENSWSKECAYLKFWCEDFPDGPVVKTLRSLLQGAQVRSPVEELRSCKPCSATKKKKKKMMKTMRQRLYVTHNMETSTISTTEKICQP